MTVYRNMTCGDVRPTHVGQNIVLSGWVHRSRNLGAMVFIDLRDRYGITQIMCDPRFSPQEVYEASKELGHEYVICIEGEVVMREKPNHKIPTGLVEVRAHRLKVLSEADVPPFAIADDTIDVHEDLRLRYRYLDMRRGGIIPNLVMRHNAMQVIRHTLTEDGFIEVSTPTLSKSTPEGSRDYLVPSRVHKEQFYALPQSPQMFKQILMVGGLDKYFQIVACCRDEDLRADRQPEFHQIDMEMSFATQDELFPIVETLVKNIFHACGGIDIAPPFRRMTHKECMEKYGTDKPDLRFEMELVEATDLAAKTSSALFNEAIASGGIVRGLNLKGGARLSRKEIEAYQQLINQFGFKGIAWMKRAEDGLQGGITKFIEPDDHATWIERFTIENGDCVMVIAGPKKRLLQALDQLRRKLGKDFDLIDPARYEPLWVMDFPLFMWNEDENRMESETHPFTSPRAEDMELLESNPLSVRSMGYDLVLNGYEIASGSQRIHDKNVQERVFEVLGLSKEEVADRFGFFVEALTFGTPPHIGIGLGLDRLVMSLVGTENIKDVIAFPKNHWAQDLMTGAPSQVYEKQLDELGM